MIIAPSCSDRRAGLLQKISFLGRAGSTENFIPVREAAEAGNDLMMMTGGLDKGRFVRVVGQRGIEAHLRFLIGEALAVLERQIKEAAPNRRDRTIMTAGNGLTGGFKRPRIRGIGPRRMAE